MEENDGSITVTATYTVAEPTADRNGMAFVLYSDQSIKWFPIAQLEEEESGDE
jgi:hypothetical protein